MTTKLSRRKFLFWGIFSGISLYPGAWWFFKVRKPDPTNLIVAVLRKHLGYLELKEADLVTFAQLFQQKLSKRMISVSSWIGMIAPIYERTELLNLIIPSSKFRGFEESVVSTFLLSTDFFRKGGGASKEINYLQFYDPYTMPCANPFAKFK